MAIMTVADLLSLAQECFDKAKEVAEEIQLATFAESKQYARAKSARFSLLAQMPDYEDLETFHGIRAWGALLAFDLRKSSELAVKLGPRDTYVVMHTYLPTMLKIIESAKGIVVGLRGDGAIACFGLVQVGDDNPRVTQEQGERAVVKACDCGDAVVKAVQKVVNPVLKKGLRNSGDIQVGVGIDVGEIVATRIGLGEAHELTAYGTPVNHCCKRSFGNDMVILTKRAKDTFPKSGKGRTRFPPYSNKEDAFILRYPEDYRTLA